MDFLRLIRYPNLLMLAFLQLIIRYGFLKLQNIPLALSDWQHAVLILSTISIAAGGYIINNIFDQETDSENRPGRVIIGHTISESAAYNYYVILNVIGVGAGFFLANLIGKPGFAMIFIAIAGALYLYAANFKQSLLTGNFIVAILLSFSVIITGIFDLFPIITPDNQPLLGVVFQVLLDYAIFAFLINLLREIVKDLEDVNGDYNQGMKTLPIVLGVSRTARLLFWFSLIPTVVLAFYIYDYFFVNNLITATIYSIVFVVAPLIYFNIRLWSAQTQKEFRHLSTVLKIILLFGIISLLIVSLNIKWNA